MPMKSRRGVVNEQRRYQRESFRQRIQPLIDWANYRHHRYAHLSMLTRWAWWARFTERYWVPIIGSIRARQFASQLVAEAGG
jgi:hypothetical protein